MSVKGFIRNTRLLLEHAVHEAQRSQGSHYAPKAVQLAKLSTADVAARTNTTGHRDLGGNSTLEYATGFIQIQAAIDALLDD